MSWWTQTVYPPRYFCGFITVNLGDGPERLDFIDAPIVPIDVYSAAIFVGSRGGCYYSERLSERRMVPLDIQYAISVLDGRITGRTQKEAHGRIRIEKFNHKFRNPGSVRLGMRNGMTQLFTTRSRVKLYEEYPIADVLDHFRGVNRKVLQFVA